MRLQLYGWYKFDNSGFCTTQEDMFAALRDMRDVFLKESDWTQIPDCALPQETIDQWKLWRQYMRDLPSLVETPLEYTLLINDPPVIGYTKSWDNWDKDKGPVAHGSEEL